jgi:hypothetical protein
MKLVLERYLYGSSWIELIGKVVAGLNIADRYEKFYNTITKIEKELNLDYDNTIDRWLNIPNDEEELPSCWKK